MEDRLMDGRILGLDYGSKTVGVAVTDGLNLTALSLDTIRRDRESHLRSTYRSIEQLIKRYEVSLIVVGLPLNMDGSEGERAHLARSFAGELTRRTHIKTVMQDERLTTVEADELLSLQESSRKKAADRERIDSVAAAVILTDYLNGLDR